MLRTLRLAVIALALACACAPAAAAAQHKPAKHPAGQHKPAKHPAGQHKPAKHPAEQEIDTPKAERAIAWYERHIGSTAFEGYCELAAERAFGTVARYASAADNWDSRRSPRHRDWRNAPRGALVFWDTSADRHVAISLGNGWVLTTSAPGREIGRARITWFGRPLGWKRADWA